MKKYTLKVIYPGLSFHNKTIEATDFRITDGAYVFMICNEVISTYPVNLTIIEEIERDI